MPLRFAYTRPDGGVTIVNAAPKSHLEKLFGPMTDEAYEAHVLSRAIPSDAIDVTRLPDDWEEPDRKDRDNWKMSHVKAKIKK